MANSRNQSFLNASIERDKIVVEVFQELASTLEVLSKQVHRAGYIQRNALISHVYSNYTQHEELRLKRDEWQRLVFLYNVHKELFECLRQYRDMYGYFPEFKLMLQSFDDLINYSIQNEDYEAVVELKKWRDKMPNY